MEKITEKLWEQWCIDNEATDTTATIKNGVTVVCGTPKEGDRTCFILEG